MKKIIFPILAGVAVSLSSQAAEHRLAYSEANQLQVFIDHADGTPWCSEKLTLRFSDPGAAKLSTLENMMPRIGALIGRECSDAAELNWQSVDAAGKVLAEGSSAASNGWALVQAIAAPAAQQVAEAASSEAAVAETAAEEPAVAEPPAPAVVAVAEEVTKPEEKQSAVAEPTEPVVAEAADETVTPEPLAEAEPVVAEAAAAVADAPVDLGFSVGEWRPRTTAQTLAAAEFASPLRDQNDCLFNTHLRLDVAPEYLRVRSEGVSCDATGLASGQGTLEVTRSDGARLASIQGYWYQGMAFTGGKPVFSLQHIRAGDALYGLLGSDPVSKVHYLIEARHQNNGSWSLSSPRVIVLTENLDLVREADSLQQINERVLQDVTALTERNNSSIRILTVSRPDAIFADARPDDSWLYETRLSRSWGGKWSPGHATNHLFDREARQARELAQAQERARREHEMRMRHEAVEQQRYLEAYLSLNQKPVEQRISEWIREPDERDYLRLMEENSISYRQVVQITGKHPAGGYQISQPYEAVLITEEPMDKGWYRVTGEVSLDLARQDKQKLPLSVIQPEQVVSCGGRDCSEQFEPQAVVAAMSGQPDWSEEKARDLIERVENGQFE